MIYKITSYAEIINEEPRWKVKAYQMGTHEVRYVANYSRGIFTWTTDPAQAKLYSQKRARMVQMNIPVTAF